MAGSQRGTSKAWAKLRDYQRNKKLPCFLCGQPIDYSLKWPDPESFSADHIRPYSKHPELRLDPGNIASTHLRCNQAKSDKEGFSGGLGSLSQEF